MTKAKSHSACDPRAMRDKILNSLRWNEHFVELTTVRIEDGM